MFLILRFFREAIYRFMLYRADFILEESLNLPQEILFWMILIHYSKENLQATWATLDQKTMGHNIFAYKSTLSWLWVGFGVAFYSFHPLYDAAEWFSFEERPLWIWLIICMFILTELMSFLSNRHLVYLKFYKSQYPNADPLLFIPQHHGFQRVTCANYFWRLCSWTLIAGVSQTLFAYLYLVYLFFDLNRKAHHIHYSNVSKYREQYPSNRRALIPYLF